MNRIILFLLFNSSLTFASAERNFKEIEIEGAKCGNGKPYKVYVNQIDTDGDGKEDNKKLSIEFMGGGACWGAVSCYGPIPKTWSHRVPKWVASYAEISKEDIARSPLADTSYVFFPYCTGDIHMGSHKADYGVLNMNHVGASNIEKALNQLKKDGAVKFDKINELNVVGASAGALGAMVHSKTIDSFLEVEPKSKKLLLDSPGLHWADSVWDKFIKKNPQLFADLQASFSQVGIKLEQGDGLLAKQLKSYCANRAEAKWDIAFIQSEKDFVMSRVFGNESRKDHQARINSEGGIKKILDGVTNCHYYTPDTSMHTFVILKSEDYKDKDGLENVVEFYTDFLLKTSPDEILHQAILSNCPNSNV